MQPIAAYINRVIHGDCIEVMRTMPAASVDLILTDPPYIVRYASRDGRTIAEDDNGRWLTPKPRQSILYAGGELSRLCLKNNSSTSNQAV